MADAAPIDPIIPDDIESVSESGTESLTWIGWFCSLPGHEYFAEVSEDFIEDDFNLTGLNALVPFYREALEMILDVEPLEEDSPKIPDVSIVESSAELLYGLIHQRYILTAKGMQQMVDMYGLGHFGYCPRVYCHSHPVLPCGRSDLPGLDTVKLFCPNCMDCYAPPSSRFHSVDGAFFGITFPHLVLQSCRDLAPTPIASERLLAALQEGNGSDLDAASDEHDGAEEEASTLPRSQLGQEPPRPLVYVPRIYGFRVSELAKSGPRMQWLRARPRTYLELIGRSTTHPQHDMQQEDPAEPMSITPSLVGDGADRRTDQMSISEGGV